MHDALMHAVIMLAVSIVSTNVPPGEYVCGVWGKLTLALSRISFLSRRR
jgi:hypothetical protein